MATSSLRGGAPRESGIDAALLVLRLTLGILISDPRPEQAAAAVGVHRRCA